MGLVLDYSYGYDDRNEEIYYDDDDIYYDYDEEYYGNYDYDN